MAGPRAYDLTGRVFGRITVISSARRLDTGPQGRSEVYWNCRCECGTDMEVRSRYLLDGGKKSCGCLRSEVVRKRRTTHGGSYDPIYPVWNAMRNRCLNPKSRSHGAYGGRGISICQEWTEFPAFRSWALSTGFSPDLQIDRIDVDGPYCPANCRWATRMEQCRNKRKTLRATFFGQEMLLKEAAERYGVPYTRIFSRMRKGCPPNEAVLLPTWSPLPRS